MGEILHLMRLLREKEENSLILNSQTRRLIKERMNLKEILSPYVILAKNTALKRGVLPELILSTIMNESSGRIYVTKYEKDYEWLYMPKHYSDLLKYDYETEVHHQSTSWGLMQVMLATARQLGFDGYAPELCVPATNIEFGARLLSQLLDKHASIDATISCYNAGSIKRNADGTYLNQSYVNRGLSFFNELRTWSI